MRWLQSEYLLKGLCLGLLLFAALQEASGSEPGWPAVTLVTLLALAGLLAALGVAAYLKLREGYRARGRYLAFIVFLLLESPTLIYAGIILGLAVGAYTLIGTDQDTHLLLGTLGGGILLGLLFNVLQRVRRPMVRLGLSLALAAALVVGILAWLGQLEPLGEYLALKNPLSGSCDWAVFGGQILLGLPIFYLLTFAGRQEETEVEIGALCAALGVALWMFTRNSPPTIKPLAFLLPLLLYVVYTMYVLPGLRIFKHSLRGHSYLDMGRFRHALLCFRRALQLHPKNRRARDGYWQVHCSLDLEHLAEDPQTLALVDFDLCLNRAGSLLLEAGPSAQKLAEAHRLLDLVLSQRPDLWAPVAYWRAVAFTHARTLDLAAGELEKVLDASHAGAQEPPRQDILVPAWELALVLHDELRRARRFTPGARPGQRMEAIFAVEQHLAKQAEDATAWNLKRLLYQDMTEVEYEAAAPGAGQAISSFDHAYVHQLGLALINDPNCAGSGVPNTCVWRCAGFRPWDRLSSSQVAQAQQSPANWRRPGTPTNSPSGPAWQRDRRTWAIRNARPSTPRSRCWEMEPWLTTRSTWPSRITSCTPTRTVAASRPCVPWPSCTSVRATSRPLCASPRRPCCTAPRIPTCCMRKDRYYYSLMPDFVRGHPDNVPAGFDLAYCLNKARSLLNAREIDLDTLDWAQHLADLALAVKPDSIPARVLLARALLRRGEKERATSLLEDLYTNRPEKMSSEEEEEGWYPTCRLLGDLYLQDYNRPDLAINCYSEYRKKF